MNKLGGDILRSVGGVDRDYTGDRGIDEITQAFRRLLPPHHQHRALPAGQPERVRAEHRLRGA